MKEKTIGCPRPQEEQNPCTKNNSSPGKGRRKKLRDLLLQFRALFPASFQPPIEDRANHPEKAADSSVEEITVTPFEPQIHGAAAHRQQEQRQHIAHLGQRHPAHQGQAYDWQKHPQRQQSTARDAG